MANCTQVRTRGHTSALAWAMVLLTAQQVCQCHRTAVQSGQIISVEHDHFVSQAGHLDVAQSGVNSSKGGIQEIMEDCPNLEDLAHHEDLQKLIIHYDEYWSTAPDKKKCIDQCGEGPQTPGPCCPSATESKGEINPGLMTGNVGCGKAIGEIKLEATAATAQGEGCTANTALPFAAMKSLSGNWKVYKRLFWMGLFPEYKRKVNLADNLIGALGHIAWVAAQCGPDPSGCAGWDFVTKELEKPWKDFLGNEQLGDLFIMETMWKAEDKLTAFATEWSKVDPKKAGKKEKQQEVANGLIADKVKVQDIQEGGPLGTSLVAALGGKEGLQLYLAEVKKA